ncbi:hypothetical protein PHET_11454 [Paragonimus heterotremus]|uniref:Uncharacterized protein n=1 Tax=Paragonimus heterotremus TaxID=100268 RepID=A0A8J4T4C0_9TREM|nr:hypothetical protein PHET_11454 [Paragonimus heterotremus]
MTTSCLGCEMIVTFQILILGNARIKIKGSLIFCLFVAFVTITAPSILAANDAFGGDLLCLPSRESALFHTFVATMAANMLVGFIVRLLVERNIETPAFIEPLMIEQLLTHAYRMTYMWQPHGQCYFFRCSFTNRICIIWGSAPSLCRVRFSLSRLVLSTTNYFRDAPNYYTGNANDF